VDTPGGRDYAELDLDAPVTREWQPIFETALIFPEATFTAKG